MKIPKQISTDILSMAAFTEIRLGVDGINAHESHHSANLFTVNQDLVIVPNNLSNSSIAPGGVSSVYLIDSAHCKQVLVGNDPLLGRFAINTAAIYAQQISLSADGRAGITEITHFFLPVRSEDLCR